MIGGQPAGRRRSGRWWIPLLLGMGALFSGAALVAHILAGISLALALALTATMLAVAVGVIWHDADERSRTRLRGVAVRGLASGLVATLLYDVSRTILSQLDPSPYMPFEALRAFGAALVGASAAPGTVLAAGTAFHFLNGACFGLAYVFLFGPAAVRSTTLALASGIGWGIFLELFQVTLYPGWLSIEAYAEFVTIGFLGHVVYGATLGLMAHRLLPREPRPAEDDAGE